jgi:hypothetical protein
MTHVIRCSLFLIDEGSLQKNGSVFHDVNLSDNTDDKKYDSREHGSSNFYTIPLMTSSTVIIADDAQTIRPIHSKMKPTESK